MDLLFFLHVAASFALVGLIWVVQLAVYPLYAEVGEASFSGYHARWCDRITWIVAPLFGLQGLGAVVLVTAPIEGLDPALAWCGVLLFLANAACTAFVSVPLHARLARSFDVATQRRLVRTNWLRTVFWSLHGLLALEMLRISCG